MLIQSDVRRERELFAGPSEQELHEELKGLDSTTMRHMRERAQKQLYFMAKGVMRYRDVNQRTHGDFCRFFQSEERDRRLGLMPRGHLKSSIATEADSVRIAVDDPEETRILIVNEILGNSQDFLKTIRQQFEKNALLRTLFPELVLDRFSGPGVQWSSEGATLPRTTTYKEPTWMAAGTGAAVTSKHFTRIKADDLIGLEAKKSPAVLRAAIAWNRNIESLAVNAYDTIIDWIGTRWLKNDLYGDIIQRYGDRLATFHRKVHYDGELIFPEKYNWEFLTTIMETTPDVWYAQYLNDPQSELSSDFDASNLQYYRFDNDGNVVSRGEKYHYTELDRVVTVDPNGGEKTAQDEATVHCSGLAPSDNAYVLASKGGRWSPSELVDITFEQCRRWRPRVVVIERAGQQNTRHYFEKKCRDEGMYFLVKDGKHGNQNKEDRIRTALEPVIATQRLFVLRSQSSLIEQIKDFPDLRNDDYVDGLSYAVDEWRKPMSMEQQSTNRDKVLMMLKQRNPITGYSGHPRGVLPISFGRRG